MVGTRRAVRSSGKKAVRGTAPTVLPVSSMYGQTRMWFECGYDPRQIANNYLLQSIICKLCTLRRGRIVPYMTTGHGRRTRATPRCYRG
jgi:hypothetical protein